MDESLVTMSEYPRVPHAICYGPPSVTPKVVRGRPKGLGSNQITMKNSIEQTGEAPSLAMGIIIAH